MADSSYAAAQQSLKKIGGQQLDLPFQELPKMASAKKGAVTIPKRNAGPVAPVQNGQIQPSSPATQIPATAVPPMPEGMKPWAPGSELPELPQGFKPQNFGAPAQPSEGLIWGTVRHLAGGTATGMKDLLTGIVDVDAENKAINAEMRPLIEQYKTASPEGQAAIEEAIGRISTTYADSLSDKLLGHGVMLTKGMIQATIAAPFNTVARGLRVLDTSGKVIIGEKDAEDVKKEWFRTLDNIIPIAMDALVIMGGVKMLKGKAPGVAEGAAAVDKTMKFKPPEERAAIDTAFKGMGAETPDMTNLSPRLQNKAIRAKLLEEKQQLIQQFKIISDVAKKELPADIAKFKGTGSAELSKEFSTGESAKLIKQRQTVQEDYTVFKQDRVVATEKFNALKDKMNYDSGESMAYKADLEKHLVETQDMIKRSKSPENKAAFEKKIEFLQDELKDVHGIDKLADMVYKTDYMDRQYQARLKAIDDLLKPRIENVEGQAAKTKAEIINMLKNSYDFKRQAVKSRILEINKELKSIGRNKGPVQEPAVKPDTQNSLAPTQNNTPEQGIKTSGDLFKAPKSPDKAIDQEPATEPAKAEAEAKSLGAAAKEDFLPKATADAIKEKGIKNIPETGGMRQIIKNIDEHKMSIVGIYKAVKNMDIQGYILKHIDPTKIGGLLQTGLEFFRGIKLPELAALNDAIEVQGRAMEVKLVKWLGRYKLMLKKAGVKPEQFFEDYQNGKYDGVLDKVEQGKAIDVKSLTLDETVAWRVKQFTDFFADVFELKSKIGEHGNPLYRKRYLPHIVLEEIQKALKEGKRNITADERIMYETITGHEFKNVFEKSRFKEFEYNKDPFAALESYGAMAVKKMSHDTSIKIFEDAHKAVTVLKNKAHTELEALKEKEEALRTRLENAKTPEAQKAIVDEIGNIDKYRSEHPQLNETGLSEVLKRLEDTKNRVLDEATFEDKLFKKAVNHQNPIATFALEIYLKTPFIKKPIQLKDAKTVVKSPGNVRIEGLAKNVETGAWEKKSYSLGEFLGKHPVTRMLTNYKAASYASILGGSIPSMITNLTQPLAFLAAMPGNKYIPFLPSVAVVKAVGTALVNVFKSITDEKIRNKYQRANIFLTMDRLYDGANFKERFLGNVVDKLLVTMKVSELFNRAFTFEVAQSMLKSKMKEVNPAQQITPIEIRRLAADLTDTFNFKYTPLHTEQLLATNAGKLAFHFGSYFVKQAKLMTGMMKKEWQNPTVRKFYNVMKRGDDPKTFLNKLNNDSRMAVVRWCILTTATLVTGKALFDTWLWQVDPRRQLFFNPLGNPLIKAPVDLIAGLFDLVPGIGANPQRGLGKITSTIGKFVPGASEGRRIWKAMQENAPEKAVFSSVSFKDQPPDIQ